MQLMARSYQRITKEQLQPVILDSLNFTEVCRKLGKKPVGGNITALQLNCRRWGIDISHMTGQAHAKGKPSMRKKDASEHLVMGSDADRRMKPTVLKRCLTECSVEYKCNVCGITEWNGKELVLEIDHIDGQYWNNQLENLQFICPNCHAQETKERGR